MRYRLLSAIARKITGTPSSGPLFFGMKPNRPASRRFSPQLVPADPQMEGGNAAA
jgi:hypothetical protein